MASYNRIILMGNLTRDPELRQLNNGQAVCRMTLASNRSFKNKQTGTVSQDVLFIDVDVWGAQAESSHTYLRKGSRVLVEGRLKLDSWKEADGQPRSRHGIVAERIVFLSSQQQFEGAQQDTGDDTTGRPDAAGAGAMAAGAGTNGSALFKDESPFEDDLPF